MASTTVEPSHKNTNVILSNHNISSMLLNNENENEIVNTEPENENEIVNIEPENENEIVNIQIENKNEINKTQVVLENAIVNSGSNNPPIRSNNKTENQSNKLPKNLRILRPRTKQKKLNELNQIIFFNCNTIILSYLEICNTNLNAHFISYI